MASVGNSLYVGGDFTRAGTNVLLGIARWDGTNWHAVGKGVNGGVMTMLYSGGVLYVGGYFKTLESTPTTNIAVWDGTRFKALGKGMPQRPEVFEMEQRVHALAMTNGILYVGGRFVTIGGIYATNIAQWNGQTWSRLGAGVGTVDSAGYMPAPVQTLALLPGRGLIAGGKFLQAGGVRATNLAAWNGVSWSTFGNAMGGIDYFSDETQTIYGAISSLAVKDSTLYAAGSFTNIDGVQATNLAKWQNGNWSSVGPALSQWNWGPLVRGLGVHSNDLYAVGDFEKAGDVSISQVARWNGTNWFGLGAGIAQLTLCVGSHGSNIFVGGQFAQAGGVPASSIARWNGKVWSALGRTNSGLGLVDLVMAQATDGKNIYLASSGGLETAEVSSSCIIKWNGTNWSAVGSLKGSCHELTADGQSLYAAGRFLMPNDEVAGLISWDGSAWRKIGQADQSYSPMQAFQGKLYASLYDYKTNENKYISAFSVWDGTNWSLVGGGLFLTNSPQAPYRLTSNGKYLYVAGRFDRAGSNVVHDIAIWDGQRWLESTPPLGTTEYWWNFPDFYASEKCLYMVGSFSLPGNPSITNFACWDGQKWTQIVAPFQRVKQVVAGGRFLYAAGENYTPNGSFSNGIARWDGTSWKSLGTGVDNLYSARNLVLIENRLYVAGWFREAGGKAAGNFSIWYEPTEPRIQSWEVASGKVAMEIGGTRSNRVDVERSADMQSWEKIAERFLPYGEASFQEPLAPAGQKRFYRLKGL